MQPPGSFLAFAGRGPDWANFLDRLPGLVRDLLGEWELVAEGGVTHGHCALVVPVRQPDGGAAVLKVGIVDDETEHEHLALQHWQGRGAVRLLRAAPRRGALLLERLHPEDLTELWDLEACEVVAGLYGRIHVPAPPQLRTVTSYVDRWTAALGELPRNGPIPRRLVEQATHLSRALCSDPASTGVLVHGDLHYENVLAADREPGREWLAIDPKPMSGDPHYELAPMLWNRVEELSGDVRAGLRRRFHTLVDGADLDEDRARDWVVVRMVINAHWTVQDAEREDRDLTAEERDWITTCIAVAKAVQD